MRLRFYLSFFFAVSTLPFVAGTTDPLVDPSKGLTFFDWIFSSFFGLFGCDGRKDTEAVELVIRDQKTLGRFQDLVPGSVVNLQEFPSRDFEIEAVPINDGVLSVSFSLDSKLFELENLYRYRITVDDLSVGQHVITVTPYPLFFGFGCPFKPVTVSFEVISEGDRLKLPKLKDCWELKQNADYPLRVGEAQGARVGNDLIITGGFFDGLKTGSMTTHAYDLSDSNAAWRPLEDYPVSPFNTHGAWAVKDDSILCICGGYLGATPGPELGDCYMLDMSAGDSAQWQALPNLPEPRGGGGMVYIKDLDSLLFTLGATRSNGYRSEVDKESSWILDLGTVASGGSWVATSTDGPYLGNHVSAITATDCDDVEHYFFFGGQVTWQEPFNNIDYMYEYLPASDEYVQRASQIEPKGHSTSAIVPYACGFFVIGGAVNGYDPEEFSSTDAVDFYDIPTDTWTRISSYPLDIKTPVCGVLNDVLTCSTGYTVRTYTCDVEFTM